MPDYALIGKKGTGKSKHAIRIMRDRYLSRGRVVATNLDVNLSPMFGKFSKKTYIRVPDKPTAFDLLAAGHGNADTYDEEKNGGLFLDEMATWLNTRSFADKSRSDTLDFFAHGRKYGWDTYYIMQDIAQVDKQLRESFLEYTVRHRRFDRVKVPFVGGLLSILFGERMGYLPRFHVAVTRAGTNPQDLRVDSAAFRGDDLHKCYDTRQIFRPDYPHGTFSQLSPWHLEGRYLPQPPKPWLLRLFEGLRGVPLPRPAARPVARPVPAVLRVRELARSLPPDQRAAVVGRFLAFLDRQGGPAGAGVGYGATGPMSDAGATRAPVSGSAVARGAGSPAVAGRTAARSAA